MAVDEGLVRDVVGEISTKMSDPQFVQITVGHFVQSQPDLVGYLSGRAPRIGGAQVVLEVVFHAEILSECLRRAYNRADLPRVPFRLLERAAQGDAQADFTATEPALASYVASNIDSEAIRLELCRLGLALSASLGRH